MIICLISACNYLIYVHLVYCEYDFMIDVHVHYSGVPARVCVRARACICVFAVCRYVDLSMGVARPWDYL